MTAILAALMGALISCGLLALVAWATTGPEVSTRSSTGLWKTGRLASDPLRSRRLLVRTGLGLLAGLAAGIHLGWPILILVGPLGFVGVPALLGHPPNRDIELLQALDRWLRALSATLPTGKSITDAMRTSRRSAPPLLASAVTALVWRLDQRWSTEEALRAFADELASPDSDAAIAALILASKRGGTGATATLGALADWIQERLKALRAVEAERAKPRVVVRQVTVITLVVISGSMLLGRDFFAPYGTPLGQAILAGLLGAYAGSLVVLRRMTVTRKRDRVLLRGAA